MSSRRFGGIFAAMAGLIGCFAAVVGAEDHPAVPYPEGYREWAFLHSTIVGPQHGLFSEQKCELPCTAGVFYFYANEKAMAGLRTGKYEDGAILMDEVLELHGSEGGGAKEGPRRGIGVMVKNSKLYAETGGWGYGQFKADSKTETSTTEQKIACFRCHEPKKDRDYVFTQYRER
jgi:hypothetical protein